MDDLITAAQVTDRLGPNVDVDSAQLASLIADASALVRQAAEGELDAIDHTGIPDVLIPVVVSAVRRALVNPDGFGSEMLDGYRFEQAPRTGVFLTKDEKRTIRRNVGLLSAGSVTLEGYLPTSRYEIVDDDPWLDL